jgi:hypothetical protein
MADQSKFEKLKDAGVVNRYFEFNQKQKDIIEGLSDDEVAALISVKRKLDADTDLKRHLPVALFL